MTKASCVLLLIGFILCCADVSLAQSPAPEKNIFVDVNFGIQPASRAFSVESSPMVYGEPAALRGSHSVDGSGMMDVMAGYRVWRDLSVALALTTTLGGGGQARVTGSIPHPMFTDRLLESTVTLGDLHHDERSAHLSVMWTSPVSDKVDASVFTGLSYLKVFQAVVSAVDVPPLAQTFTPVSFGETVTTPGFHFGAEMTFLVTPRLGAGAMARIVKATADLPATAGLGLAGFQMAAGLRVRF